MDALQMDERTFRRWINKKSIGGSSAGAVIGVNKYMSAAQLWDRIMADTLYDGSATSPDTQRGTYLEPVIAQQYAQETNRVLTVVRTGIKHPQHKFLHASPDRIIENDDNPGVLEIKCPRTRGFERTKTEGVDPSYYAQIQHYLNVTGCQWGSFAFFNAELWQMYWFDVQRDQQFIDQMTEQLLRFWNENILKRVRPGGPGSVPFVRPATQPVGLGACKMEGSAWQRVTDALKTASQNMTLARYEYDRAIDAAKRLMGPFHEAVGYNSQIIYAPKTERKLNEERVRDLLGDRADEAYEEVTVRPFIARFGTVE